MPVHRVLANDAVADDHGAAAIQRGPIVYSIEGIDNGESLAGLQLPLTAALEHHFEPDLLHGVEVITGTARRTDGIGRARARSRSGPSRTTRGRTAARARWRCGFPIDEPYFEPYFSEVIGFTPRLDAVRLKVASSRLSAAVYASFADPRSRSMFSRISADASVGW